MAITAPALQTALGDRVTPSTFATYWHRNGCGGPAFRYAREHAVEGALLTAEHARWLDGSVPVDGEEIQCGTCHRTVWPLTLSNLKEE